MSQRTAAAVVFTFLLMPPLHAGESHPWCGTSVDTRESVRELAKLGSLMRARSKTSAPNAQIDGNVIVVEPDESMIPFANFADLENSSLHFRRTGPETFAVRRSALEYEDDVGTLARAFTGDDPNDYHLHALQRFQFPFGDRTYSNLYLSERFGIFFAAPSAAGTRQLAPLDLATLREALIAPYLEPNVPHTLRFSVGEVFLHETSERVVITWRSRYDSSKPFNPLSDAVIDVQAILDRGGNIRFSYRKLQNLPWGSVAVTTGDEPQRGNVTILAGVDDPADDGNGNASYRDLLDIRRAEVRRVDDSELLSVRIRLGGRIYPNFAEDSLVVQVVLAQGELTTVLRLSINGDQWRYCTPGGVCSTAGLNAEFTDDGVVLNVLERQIPFNGAVTIAVTTYAPGTVDSVTLPLNLAGGRAVDVDLASLEGERPMSAPVLEAFTLPSLDPTGVWERVRDEFGLWESEVDGVAIYQNFPTDIVFFATAYSTVGNSGADGVWAGSDDVYGANVPRTPALLHMNRILASSTGAEARSRRHFLLGHEFGHRWLYGFTITEGGGDSYVLNPDGGHPAQYVHTAGAFRVITERDYSVMGGSNFADRLDGTFQTPDEDGAWSYSWHELYLMGLAELTEVPDWYYIAESDPPLGPAYHPEPGLMVRGRRINVAIRQLTESVGERAPEAADSQRNFRLLFVLLQLPSGTVADEVRLLNETIDGFRAYFATATGGRGSVTTTLPVRPAAQFTAPDRAAPSAPVAFRDASTDYPAAWRWEFGDGATSTEQFPRHAYRVAGTYRVKLTVENSRGASTSERQIVIDLSARTRPVRK